MITVAKRVQKHRANLRKNGLRPLQIWVPDTKRRGFAAECRRQSQLIKNDPQEKELLQLMDKVASYDGWEA